MLEFIYSGTIERTLFEKNTRDILVIAEKYNIASLKEECEQYISESMSVKGFTALVIFADTYNCDSIMSVSYFKIDSLCSNGRYQNLGMLQIPSCQLRTNYKLP